MRFPWFVAAGDDFEETQVVAAIGSLVEKSLIFTKLADGFTNYRLLNMTRAYLTQKLHEIGELEAISQRHQSYCRNMAAFMKPGDTNDD